MHAHTSFLYANHTYMLQADMFTLMIYISQSTAFPGQTD